MSWALRGGSISGEHVATFPALTIGANVGDYFEIDVEPESGNFVGNYRLAAISTTSSAGILEMNSSSVFFRPSSFQSNNFGTSYTQPSVGQRFLLRIERVSPGNWEAFIDGASIGVSGGGSSPNFPISQVMNYVNSNGRGFIGLLYGVRISTNGGTLTNHYDPSVSGGTGSTLTDVVGGNNATLVDFPTDDSQWVSIASVPTLGSISSNAITANSIGFSVPVTF